MTNLNKKAKAKQECPHCGATLKKCLKDRKQGAIACCPDCSHNKKAKKTIKAWAILDIKDKKLYCCNCHNGEDGYLIFAAKKGAEKVSKLTRDRIVPIKITIAE